MFTERFFRRACSLTIVFLLLLFLVGGFVRVTKAGMGCPDWPKCFGSWIPPTSADELPADYKEQFRDQRLKKVKRLIKVLKSFGMHKSAKEIEENKDILIAHDFSFRTMVTEYSNRLVGVATGIFAFLSLISAFQFAKSNPGRLFLVIGGLFFIGLNGWLGSIVVDTNLLEGVVTAHFVLAFIALSFYMIAWHHRSRTSISTSLSLSRLRWLSLILFTAIVLQILGGTSVREMVDSMVKNGNAITSDLLISASFEYQSFLVHKLFPFAILALLVGMIWFIRKKDNDFNLNVLIGLLIVFVLQGLSGSVNLLTGNATLSQLMHVALGGLVFALALQWLIQLYRTRQIAHE